MSLKTLLGKAATALSYPLSREVRRIIEIHDGDIGAALQRQATESTARYVSEHMRDVQSTTTAYELLTRALAETDLRSDHLILEFGVFTGGSINHIAKHTKNPIYGFDSFDGLPKFWRDGYGAGTFRVPKLPTVPPNVTLIKGWFENTLPSFVQEHKQDLSFLHVDCDLYSSTKTIFQYLGERIKPGCVIVFDEYFNYLDWENGEFKAFREFLADTNLSYKYFGYNRRHEQVAVKITAKA